MTAVIEKLLDPEEPHRIPAAGSAEMPQDPDTADQERFGRERIRGYFLRRLDAWLVAALVLVVVAVQAVNITNFPTVSDDEGTYLAQAWAIQHGHGLAHYSYWYDHPPFGWIQIAALSWVPALLFHGPMVVMHARIIMLPVTAIGAALVYVLCLRLRMARWAAALALVVFGLSPLSVTMQREIYLDNFAAVWMLAALVLALSPKRNLWHHVAAGSCAALSVLSKETMVVVAPALLMALWQGSDRATRKFSVVGFLAAAGLIVVQYPLFAVLKGELFPGPGHNSLFAAISYQLSRPGSGNILHQGTLSNLTLHWWLVRDPVLMYAGVLASIAALAFKALRPVAVASVILIAVALRPNGYLPAMYVIQALPFFAVVIAGVLDKTVRALMQASIRQIPFLPLSGANLVAFCSVVGIALLAPSWETGDETADTAFSNTSYAAASSWIHHHIADPAHTRVVVDDAMWADLVNYGFQPGLGAIWFYKVDLDPAVARTLPHGWRDIDYVVSTSIIRQDPNSLPTVSAAIAHAPIVATFGTGDQRIDIMRVDHTQ
jgi:hypothetical protein